MMNQDQTFRIVLVVAFLVVLPILPSYPLESRTAEKLDRPQEGVFILATLRPAFLAFWPGLIAYNPCLNFVFSCFRGGFSMFAVTAEW
jgi:hypothetical protein